MLIAKSKFFIRFYLRLYFFYDYMRNDGLKALHSKWRLPDAVRIVVFSPRLKAGVTSDVALQAMIGLRVSPRLKAGVTSDGAFRAIMNTLLANANRHTVFEAFLSGGDENATSKFLRVQDFREITIDDASGDLHA